MGFLRRIRVSLEQLYTGYFASVMATGIVSTALKLTGYTRAAEVLLGIAVTVYLVLLFAYGARWRWFSDRVRQDFTNPSKVFGYFTFVAATNVLANGLILTGYGRIALSLAVTAALSWAGLIYYVMMYLIFYNRSSVEKSINGSWLIGTVAAESVAVVGTALAERFPDFASVWVLESIAAWGFGIVLYLIFIAIIMYRFFFYVTTSADLSPPYWINMGAMAITTLAGSRLTLLALLPHPSRFLGDIRPFVEGLTFLLWIWGIWWIPLLILIGIWKYFVLRDKIRYDPALWSIVFPLGMFTAASETLSRLPGLSVVHRIVPWGLGVAVTAWLLVALGWFTVWFKRPAPTSTR